MPYTECQFVRVPAGFGAGLEFLLLVRDGHGRQVAGDAWEERFVVATFAETKEGTARVAVARTFGTEAPLLPQPDRFFAGGDYSLRGWAVDSVDYEGGNGLLLASAEIRFDVGRSFALAAFTDSIPHRNSACFTALPTCGGST